MNGFWSKILFLMEIHENYEFAKSLEIQQFSGQLKVSMEIVAKMKISYENVPIFKNDRKNLQKTIRMS